MGSRSSLIVDDAAAFFDCLRRFDTSAHIIIDLVPFVFSTLQLLLENILVVFSRILRLHVLHAIVVIHVRHELHVIAHAAKGLGLTLVLLLLIVLDQCLLKLVVSVLQMFNLHFLRVDLLV